MAGKRHTDQDVLAAARERIAFTFERFEKVCVSYSGGKDSTVTLNLALEEAERRGRLPLDVLFIDLEAQYASTVDLVSDVLADKRIRAHWICLQLNLRNAVSQFEPHWSCWDPEAKDRWVRKLPTAEGVIADAAAFPWFRPRMEFEDFVPAFAEQFAGGDTTAFIVGIRSDESLNRYRTVVARPLRDAEGNVVKADRIERFEKKTWTARQGENTYNVYPIYDWRTTDVWTAIGTFGWSYNSVYDSMALAGVPLSQMRICQPFGDDQRKSLKLWPILEPETWPRILKRVAGSNFGKDHANTRLMGHRGVTRPAEHATWESYVSFLLSTQPPISAGHYRLKIGKFLAWWNTHGFPEGIPDEADSKLEASKKMPSWRRIAKCILANDFWCKGLSFGQTKNIVISYYDTIEKKAA